MGRRFETVIYCSNGKDRYNAIFEEEKPSEWYGIKTIALPRLSFFDRKHLTDEMKKVKKRPYYIAKNLNNSSNVSINGSFYTGDLVCPFCGNTGYVKCGICGSLTCSPVNSKKIKCAMCGNSGVVEGFIDNVSGGIDSKSGKSLK